MHSGIFPDILKTGIVSPVYKKGNPQLLDNYRPISTLPIFSKLFEKLIYVRIYNFLIYLRMYFMKNNLVSAKATQLPMQLIIL